MIIVALKRIGGITRNGFAFFGKKLSSPQESEMKKGGEGRKEEIHVKSKKKGDERVPNGKVQAKVINWKKYGNDVSSIFENKREILDIDLAFLAQKLQRKELVLTQQLTNALKVYVKCLKSVDFSLLPQLLNLLFSIGVINPPQLFLKAYVDYYRANAFAIEENQGLNFPSYFLKKVGYETIMVCAQKDMDEFALALRYFGSVLSLNELKKIDEFSTSNIAKMKVEQVAKLLNIFRQIRKKGSFVELAEIILVQRQKQISPKSMIMTSISFLQLGNREGFTKLQDNLVERIVTNTFSRNETISIMFLLHKYKVGNLPLWPTLYAFFMEKDKKISFEFIFVLMSGLSRNYKIDPQLLVQLLEYQPTLKYAENLQDKQFVEFYFVLYAHFIALPSKSRLQYEGLIASSIKTSQLKSVYTEIKYFFLFLFESNPQTKKEHLKKAYPDDTLLSLLSHIYPFENIDIRQKQAYQQDILTRFAPELWLKQKQTIVAEQFIRYKLMSVFKEEVLH